MSTDNTTSTTHPVVWAPAAIKDAVEHAAEAFKAADGGYARVSTFELSALIDATRTLIEHNEHATAQPKVVCLSGSMRFEEHMRSVAVDLSLDGYIVTGPFVNMKRADPRWETDELAEPIKVALDGLHFAKIDLADEVVVVSDESGYIGDSTRNEIAYAEKHGKPVSYRRVSLPHVSEEEAMRGVVAEVGEGVVGTLRAEVERVHAENARLYQQATDEVSSLRAQLADATRTVDPERVALWLFRAKTSRLKPEDAAYARRVWDDIIDQVDQDAWLRYAEAMLADLGLSASAPETAPEATPRHVVTVTRKLTCWVAQCHGCPQSWSGTQEEAEDWADGHQADTLVPQLQPVTAQAAQSEATPKGALSAPTIPCGHIHDGAECPDPRVPGANGCWAHYGPGTEDWLDEHGTDAPAADAADGSS